jgi:hypothetical protein
MATEEMKKLPVSSSQEPSLADEQRQLYHDVLEILEQTRLPYSVSGAFGLHEYTGIWRNTKDLDVFMPACHLIQALDALKELARILTQSGVHVLDGTTFEHNAISFAGVKGFLGGYGRWMLAGFGEPEIKALVQTSVNETEKLEHALAGTAGDRTVVVLHYSPITETLVGESPEIFPYLGTSRLADAIDHHGVDLVVHGHAHRGSLDGRTPGGVPVHNVSLGLVLQTEGRPYRVFEV